eukprot:GSChrysophyteH1.ASY1.ANO1.2229.1 assembled CDS
MNPITRIILAFVLIHCVSAAQNGLNVLDYGANPTACDDTESDNTNAFQSALDDAFNKKIFIVYAPPGCYRFTGPINVPQGVTLKGSYTTVPSHTQGMNDQNGNIVADGTVLMPTHSRDDENGTAFMTVTNNAAVRGFVVYYPDQRCDQLEPAAYPYSIKLNGDNASVQDVELLNSFNGISAINAGRHYIARVQGQPLNIGVFVDETYDIGRIEDVHFNPWFCFQTPFVEYQLRNGRSFVFARSDWEYVFNTFSFGYAIGYHFVRSDAGAMNGNLVGIGADLAVNASVLVEDSQQFGLLFTNGEFTSFKDNTWLPDYSAVSNHVVVADSNTGPVRFVNSAFWGPATHVADVGGSGLVSFQSSEFVEWAEQDDQDAPAINLRSGKLQLVGNNFQKDKNQIKFGENTVAIVSSNMFAGKRQWIDEGSKTVQDSANIFEV